MVFDELLDKLNAQPREVSQEIVRVLMKIAENVLKDPKNTNLRVLKKSNTTIASKILRHQIGRYCLEAMGFQENSDDFLLPASTSLTRLQDLTDTLLMWKESVEIELNPDPYYMSRPSQPVPKSSPTNPVSKPIPIRPIVLPPLQSLYREPFFHHIEVQFHSALRYNNKAVQLRAKNLIPIERLEQNATERFRLIQEHVKKNKLEEPNISIQDMMIIELLQWFKTDFFVWVDSPVCENCFDTTQFSHMSTDRDLLVHTDRVEMHKCKSCSHLTPFPRYNDLNILLETRKGRCGEWANTFTLFCKAMDWDARLVLDENDHVWTEVYSIGQKRWLHCDSCENICDKPLIYETGWKKKISYVLAYSDEDIQDVTWRYSSNHKEVLKRRTRCDELKLINVIIELRKRRQATLSESKRSYLQQRLVLELVEFLMEKKPGKEENKGRESGDEIWRLARGEIKMAKEPTKFVWRIDPKQVIDNKAIVKYSAANDTYHYITGEVVKSTVKNWFDGTHNFSNITRKEEKDWKKVYLARREGTDNADISWKFEFDSNSKKQLDRVHVEFSQTTFENGNIKAQIYSGDVVEPILGNSLKTWYFAQREYIVIEAKLSGGKGDESWQHTQLFRQDLDSKDFPFCVTFYFK
ncbi:unnamed protein product [Ceutorhynchus assimilis]|uniref:Peptide-N(4)-(N-acetyl-beta-glucosaminyl)asparagine amidase n=1 Tax=Ceutorhynchus assimilis TaxID=467358 RepID=A0A9N9QDV4_9CUCU|nr:unnamed protein product [Ceutorhynchus assimilis]